MKRSDSKYDVVIIGAGIGGLVCGCYLAKAGMKVLIIEKNDKVGGCCVSFKRGRFRFDAGAHIIGSCNARGVMHNLLRRLNIDQKFIRMEPAEQMHFPYHTIKIPSDYKSYICLLQNLFPNEKKIEKFFEVIIKISRLTAYRNEEFADLTYQQLLDRYLRDDKLKAILSGQAGFLGVTPANVAAVPMSAMLVSYLRDGAYYPYGGAGSLAEKLKDRFKMLGGKVCVNTYATDIQTNKLGLNKVVAKDKKNYEYVFYSDKIVSDIDMRYTLFNLLKKKEMPKDIAQIVKHSTETPSLKILYIGTKLNKNIIAKKTGWHFSSYDINKTFIDCVYITAPSLYDTSATAQGFSVLEVFQMTSKDEASARGDKISYKKNLEERLLKRLFQIIPELKNNVIVKEFATPRTIENFTGNRDGSVYGWALTVGQYRRNESIARELYKYIQFVGHWTNPGGGVLSVAISGYNTARNIMRKNEREFLNVY
jgi:phytoene dehydrogenase-like protein